MRPIAHSFTAYLALCLFACSDGGSTGPGHSDSSAESTASASSVGSAGTGSSSGASTSTSSASGTSASSTSTSSNASSPSSNSGTSTNDSRTTSNTTSGTGSNSASSDAHADSRSTSDTSNTSTITREENSSGETSAEPVAPYIFEQVRQFFKMPPVPDFAMAQPCASCHSEPGGDAHEPPLVDNDALYTTLTTYPIVKCEDMVMVKPGDPDNSALLHILTPQGTPGRKCEEIPLMPNSCNQYCNFTEQVAGIRAWIEAGAPEQ